MGEISPYAITRAMSAAMSLRASLLAEDAELAADDKLLADCIEGETDVFAILDRLIEASLADGVLAEMAAARAARLKARRERLRTTALAMLEALEIVKPLERAAYTASISHRAKAIVTDAAALPDDLTRRAPDLVAIARALKQGPVAGAELSNPAPILTVRSR